MIYFLYGANTYFVLQKLKEIIIEEKTNDIQKINLKDIGMSEFVGKIQHQDLFAKKKIFIVENFFLNEDLEAFEKNLIATGHNLIFLERGPINERDKKNHIFCFLIKHAKCFEFKPMKDAEQKKWITREFNSLNYKIKNEMASKFIEVVGNDVWTIANEIKKLAVYKINSPEKEVNEGDIKFLIKQTEEINIFKMIEALAQKNRKKALLSLHQLLKSGAKPEYVLAMIVFQFRNIVLIKNLIEKGYSYANILKKMKLKPFVLQKNYDLTRKFSSAELKKIYEKIFLTDINIKTGKTPAELAFDLLISEI